jgi:hypothetical protein
MRCRRRGRRLAGAAPAQTAPRCWRAARLAWHPGRPSTRWMSSSRGCRRHLAATLVLRTACDAACATRAGASSRAACPPACCAPRWSTPPSSAGAAGCTAALLHSGLVADDACCVSCVLFVGMRRGWSCSASCDDSGGAYKRRYTHGEAGALRARTREQYLESLRLRLANNTHAAAAAATARLAAFTRSRARPPPALR